MSQSQAEPRAIDVDPFSQVYNAIWDMMNANPKFVELVKVKNRISMTGIIQRIFDKREVLKTGDFPEVVVTSTSMSPDYYSSSTSSIITKQFEVWLTTGDQRVDSTYYPLQWEIVRSLANWYAVLLALKWNGQTFVHGANPLSVTEGISDPKQNRGIKGWASIWAIEVKLNFRTVDLINYDV